MVNEQEQDSGLRPANQGVREVVPEPNKINASTPFDFSGKNLTPYGGLLYVWGELRNGDRPHGQADRRIVTTPTASCLILFRLRWLVQVYSAELAVRQTRLDAPTEIAQPRGRTRMPRSSRPPISR